MADNADQAQELQQMSVDLALKNRVVVQGTENCIDCGVLISSERQRITGGTDMCSECKELLELNRRNYRQ